MDTQSQETLKTILGKNPGDLESQEISFLRARRGYLTDEQIRIFGVHFKGLPKTEKIEEKPVLVEETVAGQIETKEEKSSKQDKVSSIGDGDDGSLDPDYKG